MTVNSRRKLKPKDAARFHEAQPALFAELANVICQSGVLPEKELHECWQMASLVHEAFPEIPHIADLAAGHGLLAWILVLLARTANKPFLRTAVSVDISRPRSAEVLAASLKIHWPELEGAVHYVEGSIDAVMAADGPETLFVAVHACGSLSDKALLAAVASGCPLAIMPCCHSLLKQNHTLTRIADLSGLDVNRIEAQAAGIDQFRIDALKALGYQTSEEFIAAEVTLCNRLILARVGDHGLKEVKALPPLAAQAKRMGEVRAYETIKLLNVADFRASRELSQRPSREWKRVFDLSFWIEDDAESERLAKRLAVLATSEAFSTNLWVHGRYVEPLTEKKSVTFRFEMKSSVLAISKGDALSLRKHMCSALEGHYQLRV